MIIWRGLGVLGFVYAVLGFGIGMGIGTSQLNSTGTGLILGGIGMLIGSGFAFWHGWYLNRISPSRKADAWAEQERVKLAQAAEQGQLVVGNVQPRTAYEADQMIEHVIAQGRAQFKRLGFHSVFWIPMQWFAIVTAVLGIVFIVGGITEL